MFKIHLRPNFLFNLFPNYKKLWDKNTEIIYKFQHEIIEKKRELIRRGIDKIDKEKCDIFIHQLFKAEAEGKITNKDVYGEVTTLIIAAHETTATLLSFTILALAENPEIQERVFNEINEVFPGDEVTVEIEDLHKLTYMDMVTKEILRLFPPLPFIARRTTTDLKISKKKIVDKFWMVGNNWF